MRVKSQICKLFFVLSDGRETTSIAAEQKWDLFGQPQESHRFWPLLAAFPMENLRTSAERTTSTGEGTQELQRKKLKMHFSVTGKQTVSCRYEAMLFWGDGGLQVHSNLWQNKSCTQAAAREKQLCSC